ncbi:MAG: glycoside hydrolase family 5 protein [Actinomycetota bacterium]
MAPRSTRLISLLLLLAVPGSGPVVNAAEVRPADALQRRVVGELEEFSRWLAANGVEGYVGEVGWPDNSTHGDADKWNALAEKWFRRADDDGLWVTAWATGEWWGRSYKLAVYEKRRRSATVDSTNSQSRVFERHTGAGHRRGVTVNGGEFGSPIDKRTSRFSNRTPGAYNTWYHYDRAGTFRFLARRGVGHVKIPFRWERVQPRLGRPLKRAEVRRLKGVVRRAGKHGLPVILDMHNYGAYYLFDGERGVRRAIGSRRVSVEDFADVWKRISRRFENNEGVLAYALMAEPFDLPHVGSRSPAEVWEQASQAALSAIRKRGDSKLVTVGGYGWDAVQVFTKHHPTAWIDDSADNLLYEVHHYWDRDHSGAYRRSYSDERARARKQGW